MPFLFYLCITRGSQLQCFVVKRVEKRKKTFNLKVSPVTEKGCRLNFSPAGTGRIQYFDDIGQHRCFYWLLFARENLIP